MNIYAFFPLLATFAYIPLFATTVSSRPFQKQHRLFILFLIPAMLWSLADYIFRSNFFPQHSFLLLKVILVIFTLTVVRFHCFTSSFFAPGEGRWLPFAHVSLAAIILLTVLGYVPRGVTASGDKLYPDYGVGIIYLAFPMITLLIRNVYIFWRRLRILDNPVLYNQILSLLYGLAALTVFTMAALLPWGKEFPLPHFGNLINAFILSYATVRHRLVDIRLVLRRGIALVSLGTIGIVSYLLLLVVLHDIVPFGLDLTTALMATVAAVVVAIFVYKFSGSFSVGIGRVFQGERYDYRQKLSDFVNKIHNVFSLKEQGRELLTLVTKAIGCQRTYLLFPSDGGEDFTTHFVEPKAEDGHLALTVKGDSPIIEYLRRERKHLTRQNLMVLPEFRSLWEGEKEEIRSNEIELFMPLISRDRLIAILAMGRKQEGRYSLEEFSLLKEVTDRVAVSLEKEYLREQLAEHEEELSVINRCSAIITSSLDIQEIYDSFIQEVKKLVDVSWAAIALIEKSELCFLALSSEIGSAWQAGERIPIAGTATEWVAFYKKSMVEPDLLRESRFVTGKEHIKLGIRSIAYLPLIAKGEAIGSLIIASRQPNAYSQQRLTLLQQLASQIAMSVENARLYAKAEERARVDALTGLFNRRSFDEIIANEISRYTRYGGVFSIIVLDLDSLKAYNDSFGHLAGDRLLRQIGTIIKSSIRMIDHAFRYGGDEFAILLPQTPVTAAYQVAERIRHEMADRVRRELTVGVGAGYVPVTASSGVAGWPADGVSRNEIIAAADAALYHAKRGGGNQTRCASGELQPTSVDALTTRSAEDNKGLDTIYALWSKVDAKTHNDHSKRVSEYALALANALDMDALELRRLETCALLHDIGKVVISNDILNKRGALTDEEWRIIKTHPRLGSTIAGVCQLSHCVPGILHHHERYDGTGYPDGLKGEEIPLVARILAIADAFAAMTSERSYSSTLSPEEALEEIRKGAGKQFDPRLAEIFITVFKNGVLTG